VHHMMRRRTVTLLLLSPLGGRASEDEAHGRVTPRCNSWNETTAFEHELAFQSCVAPGSENSDDYIQDGLLINGSAPLSGIAELLLFTYPEQVCSCMLNLENAASCSAKSAAHDVLKVYQPWCFMLAECSSMSRALLRAAFLCHAAGMQGNNTEVLCADDGANACALATENLFDATHTDQWVNDTDMLETLRVPTELVTAANGKKKPKAKFGQLSYCMQRVGVTEESLNLPMTISVLSGNGSFELYDDLFEAKCKRPFAYSWLVEQAAYYSGASYAYEEWQEDTWYGEAVAIAILVGNVVGLLCLLRALFLCVKRGYCYRLCSPSTETERTGLTEMATAGGGR